MMKKSVLMLCSMSMIFLACSPKKRVALATIESASDSTVTGEVRFEEVNDKVAVSARIKGLTQGSHGFHIHEHGDCSAHDASSAGGHFNPTQASHGAPGGKGSYHAGDLGNIIADEKGEAEFHITSSEITLGEGAHSIIGRSVMIHADPDDLMSQPAGNSGVRIGCGRIALQGK